MTNFTIYPAIDLRDGKVVRLKYGDPNQQTVFGDDPAAAGQRWIDAGTAWLHVVNLDGAFDEKGAANWQALAHLTKLGVNVQFGGGIRTLDDVKRALDLGATRVILGTAAVENPEIVAQAIAQCGADAIVVGLDARDGIAKTRGWQTDSGVHVHDLGRQMAEMGVQTTIHTDIGRDGVLTGVNWQASQALAAASGLAAIASGGVAALADIEACLAAEGISGVITGRAIYDGRLDLKEAIELVMSNE
ncbi:MAG: 1-(5-phosphoribosyl)-5-[(5-phosphoribosylamino)methylideneamino]imidazole-4-carboxamide isomerase [Anaerolineales bacterium]|nr:1-(5-phosphoribosyl)-5-[(5-phosphoribosylamino)methylideneamino]imidazole-4-carboxamide isomerase [Anaerolineales bacterium]